MDRPSVRIGKIVRRLEKAYPSPHTMLAFETPIQILVATILSAQCTDERVNKLTPALFRKYPSVRAFAGADRAALELDVRPTGFFRNKAKSIIGSARRIVDDFGGRVPDTMAELVTLPGVARKTANIVLSSVYGKAEGIAVDVHVKRLSGRLGLSAQADPEKIERDLLALVPKRYWLEFNYLLVNHGRAVCPARKPKCPVCVVNDLCPSAVL
jgi:endonuclease-3